MENRGQMVLQLPLRMRVQQRADATQPDVRQHLQQYEGNLQRYQRRDPPQLPGTGEPTVATAGAVTGGRCTCPGLHGLVQLPQSRNIGRTPRSEYHDKGCFRFGHDDDPFLRNLRLDVVLPERHDGALHDPQLRLQRDPEDSRSLEREGIRMVATRRPLGSRVQSPPPPYGSGEKHHDLQPRTSRESSSDDDNDDNWICLFEDRRLSPSPTRRSRLRPRGDQNVRRGRRG
jgi:hypothetical protein